jgi:hypothetical protein
VPSRPRRAAQDQAEEWSRLSPRHALLLATEPQEFPERVTPLSNTQHQPPTTTTSRNAVSRTPGSGAENSFEAFFAFSCCRMHRRNPASPLTLYEGRSRPLSQNLWTAVTRRAGPNCRPAKAKAKTKVKASCHGRSLLRSSWRGRSRQLFMTSRTIRRDN